MNNNVKLQNFERLDIINRNIYTRNIPSNIIQPNFDPRPVMTKYSTMQTLDNRKNINIPIIHQEKYDNEKIFFSGTNKPHYAGFATNIDKESALRNQFFALQKDDRSKYIPSSKSDMYVNDIYSEKYSKDLENSLLFNKETFDDFNPNVSNLIGNQLFNNSTRVQLKKI